jgi:hypothetical protein
MATRKSCLAHSYRSIYRAQSVASFQNILVYLQSIDIHTSVGVEERLKLAVPVALRILVKPIGKRRNARPHFAFVDAAISYLQEYICVNTIVERGIILVSNS